VANSAKAREKVDSLGRSERRSQPQIRRKVRSTANRSISAAVVGMASTALATKARAICGRSSGERPRPPGGGATKASKPRVSRMMISRSSLAVTGSISSSSHGKSAGCRLIHPPQYRFASSSIQTSTNIDHDMNQSDLSMQAKYAALYHWRYSYPRVFINSYSIQ
jgi:hypothetical protein